MTRWSPPYPSSTVLQGIDLNWSTHQRHATGSDNWQLTWADDDHQYCPWGDGGGFGGTNDIGRVSLGVARVEGDSDHYTGHNVWGGFEPERPAQFPGKSWGMAAVDGALYMWVSPDNGAWGNMPGHASEVRLYRSDDHGRHWTGAKWMLFAEDGVMLPTFIQFGKDYAGAPSRCVYAYFIQPRDTSDFVVQTPGVIYLARCPRDRLMEREAWEFWRDGLDDGAAWTTDIARKRAVFADACNGTGWTVSAMHHSTLNRYLVMTEHGRSLSGNLGMFDAPTPWGPWTTVAYLDHRAGEYFGAEKELEMTTFFWNIPTRWLDNDAFTLVFTGVNSRGNDDPTNKRGTGDGNDSWNTVRGRFVRASG